MTKELLSLACADLLEMLTYGRPHGSIEERLFTNRFVDSLADTGATVDIDAFGNRWVVVPHPADYKGARVLWSCHVDTVHAKGGRQEVAWLTDSVIGLKKRKPGRCLGADDGAGVFLLREMILAGVPGTYVFHRGEEVGRLGSRHVKKEEAWRLKPFDACVAFDRKGTDNLITFQMGERGCSEAFAQSLSVSLADASGGVLNYKTDPTGSYTDSFTYYDLISECTNLSVGYQREHGPNETLDVSHLWNLRCALVRADFSSLDIQQDIGFREYDWDDPYTFGLPGGGVYSSNMGRVTRYDSGKLTTDSGGGWRDISDDDPAWSGSRTGEPAYGSYDSDPLIDLCREFPETAAGLLDALGIDAGDFLSELQASEGTLPARALGIVS